MTAAAFFRGRPPEQLFRLAAKALLVLQDVPPCAPRRLAIQFLEPGYPCQERRQIEVGVQFGKADAEARGRDPYGDPCRVQPRRCCVLKSFGPVGVEGQVEAGIEGRIRIVKPALHDRQTGRAGKIAIFSPARRQKAVRHPPGTALVVGYLKAVLQFVRRFRPRARWLLLPPRRRRPVAWDSGRKVPLSGIGFDLRQLENRYRVVEFGFYALAPFS